MQQLEWSCWKLKHSISKPPISSSSHSGWKLKTTLWPTNPSDLAPLGWSHFMTSPLSSPLSTTSMISLLFLKWNLLGSCSRPLHLLFPLRWNVHFQNIPHPPLLPLVLYTKLFHTHTAPHPDSIIHISLFSFTYSLALFPVTIYIFTYLYFYCLSFLL